MDSFGFRCVHWLLLLKFRWYDKDNVIDSQMILRFIVVIAEVVGSDEWVGG